MTKFISSVFAFFAVQRSLVLQVIVCVLSFGTTCMAQHHGHHHYNPGFGGPPGFGGGAYNNLGMYNGSGAYSGPYNYNYGGFNASAPLGGFNANAPLGGVSFGNGFGTATYSQRNFGTATYGNFGTQTYGNFGGGYGGYGGYGGFNYGIGYGYPGIWSTPIYNYSPSVFGYGTGVFSPNFPSGNYISNGYVGFVPSGAYDPWCNPGWPSAVGINSYFPGTGIAPTVLMLNMNLNMQPEIPSASSYSLVDPRVIDQMAPAVNPDDVDPNNFEQAPIPQPPAPGDEPAFPDARPSPMPADGDPILNEFQAVPRDQKVSSLTEKIHSLRYQASGDDAFHKSEYATADVFYATAIKTAPDRRAPYLRMAIVRIALADFPNAARYLKTGLLMESDASRPWCTAEELYGQKVAERARSHGGPLWNWLAERPLSADRLLLAGTFQKLRGHSKTADEMLALASHDGAEALLVSEVSHLAATDIGRRAVSHDLDRLMEQASTRSETSAASTNEPGQKRAVEQAGGIFMRGSLAAAEKDNLVAAPQSVTPGTEAAENEAPVPFEIPISDEN